MSDRVIPAVRPMFRALVEAFVPEASRLSEAEWADVEATVDYALSRRPASLRRQIVLLVRALDLLPLVRHGRRLRDLDAAARLRMLEALQDSRVLLLRRGVWGLRTLAFMGYYTRDAAAADIGYRAHPLGWRARRAATGMSA